MNTQLNLPPSEQGDREKHFYLGQVRVSVRGTEGGQGGAAGRGDGVRGRALTLLEQVGQERVSTPNAVPLPNLYWTGTRSLFPT